MSAPAGWFPDPSDPSKQRWWDGTNWIGPARSLPPAQVSPPGLPRQVSEAAPTAASSTASQTMRKRPRPRASTYIIGAVTVLLWLIGLLSSGWGGALIMAGLVAMLTGLYSLISSRPSWLCLRGRKAGSVAMGIGLAVLIVGGAITPPTNHLSTRTGSTDNPPSVTASPAVASVSPSESPSPTAEPTVTATPSPTAPPTVTDSPSAPLPPHV